MSGRSVVRWMGWDWWWPAWVVVVFGGFLLGFAAEFVATAGYDDWGSCGCGFGGGIRWGHRGDWVRTAHTECLPALVVEVAAGVVVSEDPGFPDAQVGHLEVWVALAERGA